MKYTPVFKVDPKTDAIIEEYKSVHEAARKVGCTAGAIFHVLRGIRRIAAGWKWERVISDIEF